MGAAPVGNRQTWRVAVVDLDKVFSRIDRDEMAQLAMAMGKIDSPSPRVQLQITPQSRSQL